jgi:hypothetical protein
VVENCARLHAIYVSPFVSAGRGTESSPQVLKRVFATAYLEVLSDAFNNVVLAREVSALAPDDHERAQELQKAEADLVRVKNAYGSLFDEATSDLSSLKKLRLGGVRPQTMTRHVKDLANWMWPNPVHRPAPVYRVLSGLAHSSVAAQLSLYTVNDTPETRRLERQIPIDHIEYLVFVPALLFQRALARLVGFYGWTETHLDKYSEMLARVFPENFAYGA